MGKTQLFGQSRKNMDRTQLLAQFWKKMDKVRLFARSRKNAATYVFSARFPPEAQKTVARGRVLRGSSLGPVLHRTGREIPLVCRPTIRTLALTHMQTPILTNAILRIVWKANVPIGYEDVCKNRVAANFAYSIRGRLRIREPARELSAIGWRMSLRHATSPSVSKRLRDEHFAHATGHLLLDNIQWGWFPSSFSSEDFWGRTTMMESASSTICDDKGWSRFHSSLDRMKNSEEQLVSLLKSWSAATCVQCWVPKIEDTNGSDVSNGGRKEETTILHKIHQGRIAKIPGLDKNKKIQWKAAQYYQRKQLFGWSILQLFLFPWLRRNEVLKICCLCGWKLWCKGQWKNYSGSYKGSWNIISNVKC